MKEYHKINTVFKRDMESKHKTLLEGQFSTPEFEYLAQNQWVWTEKVDGTNIRVIFDGQTVTFGGKTDNAQLPSPLLNRLAERFLPQVDRFRAVFSEAPACLYFEGYGPKIQSGGKYRVDQDVVLFDVRVGGWWLRREAVEDVAAQFGVEIVPVIGQGTLDEMVEFVRPGFRSTWGDFEAEDIVARPATELQTRAGARIITKLKCRDFRK